MTRAFYKFGSPTHLIDETHNQFGQVVILFRNNFKEDE